MELTSDPQFVVPAEITPQFNKEKMGYTFSIEVNNLYDKTLYFYIASTFGFCLKEETKIRCVEGNSKVTLDFWLKITNLVYVEGQTIAIFASKHKCSRLMPLNDGIKKEIKVHFEDSPITEQFILDLLKTEVKTCVEQIEKLKQNGQLELALEKSEEAYEIDRQSPLAIEALIDCRTMLKDYQGAIRDISGFELKLKPFNKFHFHFMIKKLGIIIEWQKQALWLDEQLFSEIKNQVDIFKKAYCFSFLQSQERQLSEELLEKFKKLTKKASTEQSKENKLLTYLREKAIENFNEEKTIAKYYPSKEILEDELKSVLVPKKEDDSVTPQEVLDPISYQILKKPCILPSGASVEQNFLQTHFNINGYKDPITRQPVQPNKVYPNNALEKYIRTHPMLKKWQRYEHDFINN